MSEALYFLEQAERCRRLAAGLRDPHAVAALRQLADDFSRRAGALTNEIPPPVSG